MQIYCSSSSSRGSPHAEGGTGGFFEDEVTDARAIKEFHVHQPSRYKSPGTTDDTFRFQTFALTLSKCHFRLNIHPAVFSRQRLRIKRSTGGKTDPEENKKKNTPRFGAGSNQRQINCFRRWTPVRKSIAGEAAEIKPSRLQFPAGCKCEERLDRALKRSATVTRRPSHRSREEFVNRKRKRFRQYTPEVVQGLNRGQEGSSAEQRTSFGNSRGLHTGHVRGRPHGRGDKKPYQQHRIHSCSVKFR